MRNVEDLYPLTPLQQGMLLHTLEWPGTGVYVERLSCTLRGALDVEAFKTSWEAVCARHPALRTLFLWQDLDEPLQAVRREVVVPWHVEDWRGRSAEAQGQALDEFLARDLAQGFALERAPLMRLALLRLADDRYRLIWSHHHLILDGWARIEILGEIFALYRAKRQGVAAPLRPVRSFRDHVAWLRQQDVAAAEALWRRELAGIERATPLPLAEEADGGGLERPEIELVRVLDADLASALRHTARQGQITLNTVFEGLWALLLARLGGEADVVFGAVVAGRPPELATSGQTCIGSFINTLPVRVRCDADGEPARSWLARLQARRVAQRRHEFTALADVQRWSEVSAGAPLFENLLVFENHPTDLGGGGGPASTDAELRLEGLDYQSRSHYPLNLVVVPGETLELKLKLDTGRYTQASGERLMAYFETLLRAFVTQPEGPLGALQVLGVAERQHLLREVEPGADGHPGDRPVHEWIRIQAASRPERIAIDYDGEQLSYGDLERQALGVADALATLGIGPEDAVGLCAERSPRAIVGMLGALMAGGVYLPLDPELPDERLAWLVRDAGASVVLTDEASEPRVPSKARVARLDRMARVRASIASETVAVDPDQLAMVIYTSGSTGHPKGVAVTHRNVVRLVVGTDYLRLGEDRVLAQTSTTVFDAATFEIWGALTRGARLAGIDRQTLLDPPSLVRTLRRQRIDALFLTTALFHQVAREVPRAFETVGDVLFGGEAIDPRAVRTVLEDGPPRRLLHVYGPTECTTFSTWHPVQDVSPAATTVPIGRALATAWARVVDRGLRPMPFDVAGELMIGGLGLARGYLRKPAVTAEAFIPDLWSDRAGQRLYRTGDLVRWRSPGALEFLGRLDDQVKIRGFRIEPSEIARTLLDHPQVDQAAVLVRESGRERHLVAYVRSSSDSPSGDADWRQFLAGRLPSYMVPTAWVTVEDWPLTAQGKVDRRALRAIEPQTLQAEDSGIARTPVEEMLAGIWSEVLKRPRVGVDEDFYELGGHSLLATQVASRAREAFAIDVPLRWVLETRTISDLAPRIDAALKSESADAAPTIAPLAERASASDAPLALPLSFAQQRLWVLDRFDPGMPAYNIPLAVELHGPFDIAALGSALRALQERHETLRTTFREGEDGPLQVISDLEAVPEIRVAPEHVDLETATDDDTVRARLQDIFQHRFDLARGPLWRVVVLRLGAEHHVLTLVIHHIVADGWSLGILWREIAAFYSAARTGRAPGLAPLAVQYGDFAVWQRQWLSGEVLDRQIGFWREGLADVPPLLDLPTDRPRPAVQTFSGALLPVRLSGELHARLMRFSHQQGATLFMTLLASFGALLGRHAGQDHLAVGAPIAGRNRLETESLVGFFVNTLVHPVDLTGDVGLQRLVERQRQAVLGAYAHQDLPFEKLVDELQPRRNLAISPLFQVLFALQNLTLPSVDLDGLRLEPVEASTETSKFDLTLTLFESDDGLVGSFEYNIDLFDAATLERWSGHLAELLSQALEDPERPLAAFEVLTASERQQLASWNSTGRDVEATTIHHLIEAQVDRTPEAEAVIFEDQRLTYAELDQRANRLANYLAARGLTGDAVVAIALERGLDMVVSMIAVLKAGAAYLPLDPAYPEQRLAFMLEDSGARLLLTHEALLPRLPRFLAQIVPLDRAARAIDRRPDSRPEVRVQPQNLAYLIYTSGSTGKPKGVMVQHGNAVNLFAGMTERIGEEPGTWLALTSMSFDISVLELFWTLTRGFRVVVQGDLPMRSLRTEAVEDPTTAVAPSNRPIDFSLFYFASDSGTDPRQKYRLLLEGARFADTHEFAAVWTPERHFHAFGGLYPNPSVTGAAVAAVTERVGIRAGSVVLPLHHPLRVAEEWSVVDNISGGRVGLSFASGWHADDFVFAPNSFADRKDVMTREIETVRRLWRGDAVSFRGGAGNDVHLRIHPSPLQDELPIWVTAAGNPETFAIAGRLGAGVLTHLLGQSLEDLGEKIVVYRKAWREAGHDGDGHVTLMLHTFVGDDLEAVRAEVRQPFIGYLMSSSGLLRNLARSLGEDVDALSDEDLAKFQEPAFERYFQTGSLMGTPESCRPMVERLKRLEVDEIACLIDFGIDTDKVLESLPKLDALRQASQQPLDTLAVSEADAQNFDLAHQLVRHGVTHLQGTPSLATWLVSDPSFATGLSQLEHLMLGGEELPADLAATIRERTSARVHNFYGPTETTVWSSTEGVDEISRPMPIGRPIANTALRIFDPRFGQQPVGVGGELLIGGLGVVRGYLGRPSLTAERFCPDPLGKDGERLYRTGDLARYRADGKVEFLGRIDHQIKIRGHRIEPGEIEIVLRQLDGVRDAAVVARADGGGDPRLIAYVVGGDSGFEAPVLRVGSEEREQLLDGRRTYHLPNGMVIAQHDGPQARASYNEVFLQSPYLRHGVSLEDGAVVFDVGANTGFFSMYVSQVCEPSRIVAFEPLPPNRELLEINAALYGRNVEVVAAGAGSQPSDATFTFYPRASGLSGVAGQGDQDRSEIEALIRQGFASGVGGLESGAVGSEELDAALDSYLENESFDCRITTVSEVIRERGVERIDLLKVDAERSEVEILRGIEAGDWPKIQQIVAEVHSPELLAECRAILEAQGFEIAVDDDVIVQSDEGDGGIHVYQLYAKRDGLVADEVAPDSVPDAPVEPDVASWRAALDERLPAYMVPSAIVPLDALPRTPNRKLDRGALPDPDARRSADAPFIEPRSAVEHGIAEVWRDVLSLESIGIDDNFFEIGGNSLSLALTATRLREAPRLRETGVEVTIVDLFRYPTIRSLAAHMLRGEAAQAGSTPAERAVKRPASADVSDSAVEVPADEAFEKAPDASSGHAVSESVEFAKPAGLVAPAEPATPTPESGFASTQNEEPPIAPPSDPAPAVPSSPTEVESSNGTLHPRHRAMQRRRQRKLESRSKKRQAIDSGADA